MSNALARHRLKRTEPSRPEEKQQLVNNLFHNIGQQNPQHFRLALSTGGGIFLHEPTAIVMLEAHSNYTRFYFATGKSEIVCQTLKDYEDLLAEHGFARVHKSYLINRAHVVKYSRDGSVQMDNGQVVPISRRRRA